MGAFFFVSGCGGEMTGNNSNEKKSKKVIHTVTGTIDSDKLGLTLPHEHIMCDFIGADKVSRERYDADEVVTTMLPYLKELKEIGVKTLIDCTPAYLGRDPIVLARLSRLSGVTIVTNTGFYKEPYLPKFTWEISGHELAELWAKEITEGIEGTGIKAGFMKIAVNPGKLIPIQRKIVTAACRTHKLTGAAIASHTGSGVAALEELEILEREKVNPQEFIFVHADSEPDQKYHFEIARRGAWVEYDGIREDSAEKHIQLIRAMVEKGFEDNLLLSQDAGWYNVGEPRGGTIRGYAYLVKEFLPVLQKTGFSKDLINKLTITNPRRAFEM